MTSNLKNLPVLSSLLRCLHALLLNPHHNIEPYLHQLMPTVLTCMVAKRLSKLPSEPHWALREAASTTLALICRRYGGAYPNIQVSVPSTRTGLLTPERAGACVEGYRQFAGSRASQCSSLGLSSI